MSNSILELDFICSQVKLDICCIQNDNDSLSLAILDSVWWLENPFGYVYKLLGLNSFLTLVSPLQTWRRARSWKACVFLILSWFYCVLCVDFKSCYERFVAFVVLYNTSIILEHIRSFTAHLVHSGRISLNISFRDKITVTENKYNTSHYSLTLITTDIHIWKFISKIFVNKKITSNNLFRDFRSLQPRIQTLNDRFNCEENTHAK